LKYLGKKSVASFIHIFLIVMFWSLILGILIGVLFRFWTGDFSDTPRRLINAGVAGVARITTSFAVSQTSFFIYVFWSLIYVSQIISAFIIYLAIRVFSFLKSANPFNNKIVSLIKRIGLITFILSTLQVISEISINAYLKDLDNTGCSYASFSPGLSGIFFGLIILVIAQVFFETTQLKEEQSLII
jgi:hypothetical protein